MIKKRAEFSELIKRGLLFQGSYFSVFYNENELRRMGFSARHGLSAVQRNRLRRLGREVWRRHQEEISITGDFILIARERALNAPFTALENDFRALVAQIIRRMARSAGPMSLPPQGSQQGKRHDSE
ncbi:MAG TPA: ribonuclease P protein component [bacterium]|nr:ribonuclease P protein component [bacterium]HPR86501.1 ribonuclease P protein component [bacterium]